MHSHESVTPEQWGERLRECGLRVTQGRVAALTYVAAHPHSSAAEIHGALAERLPSLSPQSVHNIVGDLTANGILRRIDLPDSGRALYEPLRGDNHHHVQCIVCHRIEDVECSVGSAPCMQPHGDHGMRVLEAAVTFRGICAECDAARATEQQRAEQHGAAIRNPETTRTSITRTKGSA